ncbi:hypothetical protein [Methylobacterium sp. JK268]
MTYDPCDHAASWADLAGALVLLAAVLLGLAAMPMTAPAPLLPGGPICGPPAALMAQRGP